MAEPVSDPTGGHDAKGVLSRAREGSHEAGRILMQTHGPSMLRTAWSVLGRYGGSEAEDVVQEAFIAALTTPALPSGDVGAWLRAITVRKALDAVRGARRRLQHEHESPATGERESGDGKASPPAARRRSDHRQSGGGAGEPGARPAGESAASVVEVIAVREALGRLSASDRAVLTLVDLEGLSMKEAAAVLGVSGVAVRLRAVRARRKLASLLRGWEGPGRSHAEIEKETDEALPSASAVRRP